MILKNGLLGLIMNLNYESGKVGDYKGTPVDEFKFDISFIKERLKN